LLRFSLSDLRHRVGGFPRIDGPGPGEAFRVLYREPSRAAEQYSHQGYVNPLTFFGNGRPYWKMCAMLADALRGKLGAEVGEYAKRNTTLRERGTGAGMEYVLIRGFKLDGTAKIFFSSKAGFNVVSFEFQNQRRLRQSENYTFRKENGVFIPCRVEFSMWEGNGGKGSKALPTQHRLFTLLKTQVNKPIDPVMFEVSSMGLREGDRVADLIEDRLEVFDGKHFVPAPESRHRPAPAAKHQDVGRQPSTNNMKQIGLAMHEYHQAKGTFPPAYLAGKGGKPLLSWRVLILPLLEQDELYKQFHLDEPWDSEHNKTLIARMPAVYRSRNSTIEAEKTPYLTVRGPNTVFPGTTGISMAAIPDGTSNTIMTVEVSDAKAVVWTQPDDFQYDPRDPKRGLLGAWPDGFLAGLADGSVRFVSASVDPTVLNAFFTRNGGEKIGPEALGR